MENALIIALALVSTAVPLGLAARHGVVRLVSPMHLLGYFCLFGFAVKAIVYAAMPELAFYSYFVDDRGAALTGAIYLTLFILALCLGYRLACQPVQTGQNIAAARVLADGVSRRTVLWGLAVGLTAATALMVIRARGDILAPGLLAGMNSTKQVNLNAAGVGSTLAGLKTFFIVPKFAFILVLAYGISSRSRGALAQAASLGALLLCIAVMSGDRFELVELAIFALATHMVLGGRISGRALVWGALCGVAVLVLSVYMTAMRLGHGASFAGLVYQIVGSTYFLDINAAVMVTDRVRPDMLLLGESYFWWSFGWVPRAVWLDKPAVDLGVFFKRDVMQIYTGGAYNVTGPGEAFINFSWGGIAVGAMLGWVYRKGEVWLLSPAATLRFGGCLLYPILFYPFVQATLQSSFSAFVVGAAAQAVLIAAMVCVFLRRFARRPVYFQSQRSRLYAG